MCESGCRLSVFGVGGGAPVSMGRETGSGPWAEAGQLPRKPRPLHPWDSSFASGTSPQVTIARPHPLQLADPAPVSRPGFGVSPVPLRQAEASWGCDRDSGAPVGGEGVSPRGPRRREGEPGASPARPPGTARAPGAAPPPLPETSLLRREGGKCE